MVECICFCFVKSVKFNFTVYNTMEGFKVPVVFVDEQANNPEEILIDELEKKGLTVKRDHVSYFGEDVPNKKICYLVGVKIPPKINDPFFIKSLLNLSEMISSDQSGAFSKLIKKLKTVEENLDNEKNDFGEIIEAGKKYGLD
jgi:hypothetical protein